MMNALQDMIYEELNLQTSALSTKLSVLFLRYFDISISRLWLYPQKDLRLINRIVSLFCSLQDDSEPEATKWK